MSRLIWSAAYRLVWAINRRRSAVAPLAAAAVAVGLVAVARTSL